MSHAHGDWIPKHDIGAAVARAPHLARRIQATLDQAFAANTLPQPDANPVYAIYFPRSVRISLDGSLSCAAFGAYHESTVETVRHNAYYLVIPDCGTTFRGFTSVSSHELAEATTDAQPTPGPNPDFPQAWNDATGSEVSDLCTGTSGRVVTALGTFTVQGAWDEVTHRCPVFRANARGVDDEEQIAIAVRPPSSPCNGHEVP